MDIIERFRYSPQKNLLRRILWFFENFCDLAVRFQAITCSFCLSTKSTKKAKTEFLFLRYKSTKKTKQNKLALSIVFQAFIHGLGQASALISTLFWLIQYFVFNAFLALFSLKEIRSILIIPQKNS
ncbi:MAG: hypothetical protein AAF849_10305, partial [Bacteroidota bacterium]